MKIAKYWKRAHFLAKHNIIGLVFISYFDDNDHFVCSAIKLFKFHAIDASRWFTNLTSLMQFVFQCSKEMSFLQVLKTLNPCENCNCVEWIFFSVVASTWLTMSLRYAYYYGIETQKRKYIQIKSSKARSWLKLCCVVWKTILQT